MSGSLALAGRLLFTGVRHPRTAMRAAMAAGPGEAWRLGVLTVSAVPITLANRTVWAFIVEVYAVAVEQYPGMYHLTFAVAMIVLAVFVVVVLMIAYIASAITISAILALTGWAGPPFATVRSLVAVASWIGTIPVTVAVALYGKLWSTASPKEPSWPSVSGLLPSIVYVPYFAFAMVEAFEISVVRSFIVSVVANIGLNLLFGFVASAPKLLTAHG